MNIFDIVGRVGLLERFGPKVHVVQDESSCWEWQAHVNSHGYGGIRVKVWPGKWRNMHAHRLSYLLAYGECPDGAFICHRCNNSRCIRPDHLYAGDSYSNQADRRLAGNRPASKLTPQAIPLIVEWHREGVSLSEIGRRLGVSPGAIGHVVAGETWKEVPR
jgi:hypothetical protein